jgi:hypothetical protein
MDNFSDFNVDDVFAWASTSPVPTLRVCMHRPASIHPTCGGENGKNTGGRPGPKRKVATAAAIPATAAKQAIVAALAEATAAPSAAAAQVSAQLPLQQQQEQPGEKQNSPSSSSKGSPASSPASSTRAALQVAATAALPITTEQVTFATPAVATAALPEEKAAKNAAVAAPATVWPTAGSAFLPIATSVLAEIEAAARLAVQNAYKEQLQRCQQRQPVDQLSSSASSSSSSSNS